MTRRTTSPWLPLKGEMFEATVRVSVWTADAHYQACYGRIPAGNATDFHKIPIAVFHNISSTLLACLLFWFNMLDIIDTPALSLLLLLFSTFQYNNAAIESMKWKKMEVWNYVTTKKMSNKSKLSYFKVARLHLDYTDTHCAFWDTLSTVWKEFLLG